MTDANPDIGAHITALIDQVTVDCGAAFEPENIEFLADLRRNDRAAFESVRSNLRSLGCRVTELDKALSPACGEGSGRGPAQAEILIGFAEDCELFHTPDNRAFVDATVSGHRETMPVRSKGFRRYLERRYFDEHARAANSEAKQAALGVIEARALFEGPQREVFVRVGEAYGKIYIDLGTDDWSAVEIDATGWRIVEVPPVRFRRSAGMRALPLPVRGGRVADLRRFLNVKRNADFVLVVAWVLAAMRPNGPFPLLALSGEQGSAKSFFTAILRKLVDPNTAPLRALPREDRDLFIAAQNAFVLAFDNISGMPPWISDTLCRLATGGGFAVRALYSDDDEKLFDACRPTIINGIEDALTRADLADRAISITLLAIPEEKRRSERDLWAEFNAAHPAIFGALADALSHGLAKLASTKLDRLPRMADFAIWSTACETAYVSPGTFIAAYDANRTTTVDTVLEADAVAKAISKLMTDHTDWSGTASELLAHLNQVASDADLKDRSWPTAANKLSGRLRRAATFLRQTGLDVDQSKARRITITHIPLRSNDDETMDDADLSGCPRKKNGTGGEHLHVRQPESGGISSSSSSASLPASRDRGLSMTMPATMPGPQDDGDDTPDDPAPPILAANRLQPLRNYDADDADDHLQPVSGVENASVDPEFGEAF